MSLLITTVLFDYPSTYEPSFCKTGIERGISQTDIHVQRYTSDSFPPSCSWSSNVYESLYSKYRWYKIDKHLEYLTEIQSKYEYTLFLDATDTNFTKNVDGMLDEYLKYGHDIVVCAEKGLWPPTTYNHLYETTGVSSPYKYLNSGCMIGKTTAIISALQYTVNSADPNVHFVNDDQGIWATLYLLKKADIVLDTEQRLFFSTYLSKDKTVLDQMGNPIGIDASAYVIHDNGPWGEETIKLTEACNIKQLETR